MTNLRNLAATALALAALLAACGGQNVPIDAELSVADYTVLYDGQPQMPEITFDPPGAEIGAEVVITPEGGTPLQSGTWPTDAGVYAVVVRASAEHGGREAEGTLTIAPRPTVVVPAAGQGKVFGAAEPSLAFAFVDPAGEDVVPASASGALVREAGESLGTYAFALGDLDAGANFVLALEDGAPVFTIAASDLGSGGIVVSDATVVFDGEGRSVDVAFVPPAAGVGAVVTYGALAPGALPVDAGTYEVSVVAGTGFVGTATGTLVIAPRPIVVAPAAGQGKVFGAVEPSLAHTFVDPSGDGVVPTSATGALVREAGESLGAYAFALGDLDAGANFALALEDGAPEFTIAASALGDGGIVVTDATVVFHGEGQSVDVTFDPPAAGVGAVVTYGDLEAGVLPVDAGTYAVAVVAGTGYVGGGSGTLTISARPVNLVPTADQGKEYGAEEPAYGYGFVDPSGDGVVPTSATGALVRDSGEDVGSYAFAIGDLDAGGNFAVTLTAGTFEITPRPLALAGFAVEGKTYDGTTNAFGATFLDDRLAGDDLTVGFDVAFASSSAGAAVVASFTDLAITGGTEAGNYVLATTSGSATAAIARRALSVSNVLWADKVYDGGTGATASATLVTTEVVGGDAVSLVAQLVGEFASADVGRHSVAGSFALVGADAANYVVDPQPTGTADIDARPVTLDGAALEAKTYDGTEIASVTGTLRAASGFDRGVLAADAADLGFAGAFAQSDATVDPVTVTVSLTGSAAGNYVLDPIPSLSGAIAPAEVTVTPDAGQSKVYGDADPDAFGFVTEVLVGDATATGALVRVDGETVGSYAFEIGTLSAGANYALVLADEAATFEITTRPITLTAAATSTVYGEIGDLTVTLADGTSLRDGDVLAGELARPELGVGDHTFGLGSATLTDGDAADMAGNYAVTVANYAVTARPLTITADDAGKTYGDGLDLGSSAFTVSANGIGTGLAGAEVVTAVALVSDGTAVTATVAEYAIVASDAVGGEGFDPANYAITYLGGTLTVGARTLTIGGDFTAATTAYDGTNAAGDVDGSALYLIGVANDDDVALAPVAAYDTVAVGDDKVASLTEASSLTGADAGNYALSLDGAPTGTGTTVKATVGFGITIAGTELATEVVYDGDRTFQPNVTTNLQPVPLTDGVSYYVEITRDATGGSVSSFNPVGTYTVTVTADDARYEGASTQVVEVLARPITIASSVTDQTFGDDALPMAPSLVDGSFGRNETFVVDGHLAFDAGEQLAPFAVGSYPIVLGGADVLRGATVVTANYAISFASDYTIAARPVVVAPHADQAKVYGDAEPDAFGFEVANLVGDDTVAGALVRTDGEDVGTYAFALGTLDAGDNYVLELADPAATFTITARPIALATAEPAYVYGDADLDLTAVLAEGSTLRDGDVLAGALALSATNAGDHTFEFGDVALTRDGADAASNYAIMLATYAMAPRPATVTPDSGQSKRYGDEDPVLGYTVDLLDGDVLTGDLDRTAGEDVGTYAFDLGKLAHPDYALSLVDDAPTFEITQRAITLHATEASKQFSTADPDLSPILADGTTLRDGDGFAGALAHAGTNVGTYPLTTGSVTVVRDSEDVSANYDVTFGTFTIERLPVAFDISNPDFVVGEGSERTHAFIGDGLSPIRGLTVAVTPQGATPTFRFTYRHTHDADHVPFANPATVQSIVGLGTYEVTVTATSANHVGSTVLTVWVTDAVGVVFAQPTYEALVGATTTTSVVLVDAGGNPRSVGPAPLVVDLESAASAAFGLLEGTSSTTTVTIAPGTSATTIEIHALALAATAANLSAVLSSPSLPVLDAGAATFLTTATLAFTNDPVQVGADATSDVFVLSLRGHEGAFVDATVDLVLDLVSDPSGVVFRDAADTTDVASVTIPAFESQAAFRVRAATPGSYEVVGSHLGTFAGVSSASQPLTVTPKPVVGSVAPDSVEKAQTLDLVLTGTGFSVGAEVAFSGDDVHVNGVVVDSATQLTVNVTVDSSTDVGTRDVTVTNGDGGTSTTEGALTLTVPTLAANDDGPYGVVEGGNRALSIANDLLANDTWSGDTAWGFDGVVSATGVGYGVAGDVLTVTAPADTGGTAASLTYRIRDDVFGTTATATVAIDVTLAPVEALLFSNQVDADHFMGQSYELPSFQDIFNSWPRFSNATYFTSPNDGSTWTGAPSNWVYNSEEDRIEFAANLGRDGIVSPDGFEYFTFEGTVQSTNTDDDSIGLIAAFRTHDGNPVYLTAHRTNGGNLPTKGWGLSLTTGTGMTVIAEPTVPGFSTRRNADGGTGWSGSGASRVRIVRTGDILRLSTTDWFATGTTAPAYATLSEITLDLATGQVTYYDGEAWTTQTTSANVAQFQGRQQYGYYVQSQADTTYVDIDFVGGVARDRIIVLTDAVDGAWTGSNVYSFAEATNWSLVAGATIQSELDSPRVVTSVVDELYLDHGRSFQIFGDRVEAID